MIRIQNSRTGIVAVATIVFLVSSCLEPEEPKKASTLASTPIPSSTPSDCNTPAPAPVDLTYEGSIKALLTTNCVGCHGPSGAFPDLSTFSLAVDSADMSKEAIDKGTMPKGGPLSADKKKLFSDWVAAGKPEKKSTLRLVDESTTADDCSSFGPELEESAYTALLAADVLAECKAAGTIYDRALGACSTTPIAEYACDRGGIRAAFVRTGFQIDEILDRSLGKADDPNSRGLGFTIDQCGVKESGAPIVYLIKKTSVDNEPRLQLRTLQME